MKFRLICLTALCAAPMLAQLYPPNAQGVTMGHMHLNTRDVAAQKAFFVDALGGKAVRNGPIEMVEFPGVYVLFTKADNPPPSRGSIVDHFGFTVKDMPGSIEKWKKMGLTIEPTANPNEVYVLWPEQMRIEVYGIPEQTAPITMNHIHWNIADIPGMQAWYDKMFGARAGQRDCIACLPRKVPLEEGRLAGTSLSYSGGAATLARRGGSWHRLHWPGSWKNAGCVREKPRSAGRQDGCGGALLVCWVSTSGIVFLSRIDGTHESNDGGPAAEKVGSACLQRTQECNQILLVLLGKADIEPFVVERDHIVELWKYGARPASPRSIGPFVFPTSAQRPVTSARPGLASFSTLSRCL